jgi:hypothetical protein
MHAHQPRPLTAGIHLQLARTRGGWKFVNALRQWTERK